MCAVHGEDGRRQPYVVRWEDGLVVLPATGAAPHRFEGPAFSEWPGDERLFEKWKRHLAATHIQPHGDPEPVRVDLTLVPRPDNDYNPSAVAVSWPKSPDGEQDPTKRQIGYLYDRWLRKFGFHTLPDLASYSADGEIHVSGLVTFAEYKGGHWEYDQIVLDLPDMQTLGTAIGAFVQRPDLPKYDTLPGVATGSATPLANGWESSTISSIALRHIRTFVTPLVEPVRLHFRAEVPSSRGRTLSVHDADTGAHLGGVYGRLLLLEDERQRSSVLPLVRDAGIDVLQPLAGVMAGPINSVPNLWCYWRPEGLDFRPRDPMAPRSESWVAQYNQTTMKLWVESPEFVDHCKIYAARLGLSVLEVGLPREPWELESEVRFGTRRDLTLRVDRELSDPPTLLRRHRERLPAVVRANKAITWAATAPEDPDVPAAWMRLTEKFVEARIRLFGDVDVADELVKCRLCGRSTGKFTTPIGTEPLAYCQRCLELALRGTDAGEQHAVAAVAELAKREFGGAMLESQLDQLQIDPAKPVAADEIDLLLLLRMAVRRRTWPWTLVLLDAGLAGDGLRTGRGTIIPGADGCVCLSFQEKAVDDFFYAHFIEHEREPLYPYDPDYNSNSRRRADWILGDGTLVEMWGMPNNPVYAAKMEEKRLLASRHGLDLIGLTNADIPHLAEIFASRITGRTRHIQGVEWQPRAPKSALTGISGLGADGGLNQRNVAARDERLERCRQAVQLQDTGLTRAEIARQMGVAAETVKIFLRDGKFYRTPDADPARLQLAEDAAAAKRDRESKALFQARLGLTAPKASEAWRDADVIVNRPALPSPGEL